jgi:hypothetical protein
MLEKDFVPYEPSLALKELGFDEPCLAWFSETKALQIAPETYKKWTSKPCNNSNIINVFNVDCISAPTFSQAFRWFRDKYQIDSKIERDNSLQDLPKQYCYIIDDKDGLVEESINFNSYEEAELACLIKLIEIANEQK